MQAVNQFRDDEIDNFFRYWLKAKHADTRKGGQRFDGDYHREMFKQDMNQHLKLEHSATQVKLFLNGAFRYFTGLYSRLWQASRHEDANYPAVFFNNLNELDSQFMLVLSACRVNDPEEALKVAHVSNGIDRVFSLLQLQGAYDSNEFAGRLFEISAEIRDQPAAAIPAVFDKHLLLELQERRAVQVSQGFSYALFMPISLDRLNTRFTRYFFGRLERLLSVVIKIKMKKKLKKMIN